MIEYGDNQRENSILEERSQFQRILRNLDTKLKGSYGKGRYNSLSNQSTTIFNQLSSVNGKKSHIMFPRIKTRQNKSITS